jgi:hypothetical protein
MSAMVAPGARRFRYALPMSDAPLPPFGPTETANEGDHQIITGRKVDLLG